jgi:hypothetical protein
MKKLFALFTLVAAVVAMNSCGGPKITGTPIEKTHFTIIQPEGWEIVTNDDASVEIKHKGEKFTNFINIKEDTEAYDKALEYYLSSDGGYKLVEEINVEGGKLNVLKKDDRNSYWIIAPQGAKTDDTVKISVSTDEIKGDPLTNEEVRAILESIVLK